MQWFMDLIIEVTKYWDWQFHVFYMTLHHEDAVDDWHYSLVCVCSDFNHFELWMPFFFSLQIECSTSSVVHDKYTCNYLDI